MIISCEEVIITKPNGFSENTFEFHMPFQKREKGNVLSMYSTTMSDERDNESKTVKKIASLHSISHDKDVDGLASAAIVWRYAKSKGLDYSVTLTDYGAFDPVFSSIALRRDTLIVVSDLGVDDTTLDVVITNLKRAITQGCKIVWLDHHQWSENAIKAILALPNKPVLRINHDFCAAEIVQRILMPRDEICMELARIAHDTDFNLREIDGATALTDAVSVIRFGAIDRREDVSDALYPVLTKLAEHGLSGVWNDSSKKFVDSLLNKQVDHYRKEKKKKMRKSLAGHCDSTIHDRLVRVVEIPSGVTSTDMGTFAAKEENLQVDGESLKVADLLFMLSQGGMLGIRRGHDTVLCNIVAKYFNGGGHPFAAGGEYGLYEDFQAVCDDIFQTLSNSTDWLEND
jgi:oligoribonuclease NrnB/cAMP/cGMP phosphodiesterase (DHH superfamily)